MHDSSISLDLGLIHAPQADDDLLERCTDDGMLVEPRFFVPVIPMYGNFAIPHAFLTHFSRISHAFSDRIPQSRRYNMHCQIAPRLIGFVALAT